MSANVASIKMTELRCKRSSMSTPRKLHRTFYRHQIFVKAFLSGMWVAPSPLFCRSCSGFHICTKKTPKIQGFFFEFSKSILRVWTLTCMWGEEGAPQIKTYISLPNVNSGHAQAFDVHGLLSFCISLHMDGILYVASVVIFRVGLQLYDCTRILQRSRSQTHPNNKVPIGWHGVKGTNINEQMLTFNWQIFVWQLFRVYRFNLADIFRDILL